MKTFKVGDRVRHDTKGSATVVSKCGEDILLELDGGFGSPFNEPRGRDFMLPPDKVRAGNFYWWPDRGMVTLVSRNKFDGNIK